ncbi:streptococcal histidine triad protein [Streptococcus urinalis FB127-CNA-2]|uniref:Histidine triad protein n=1 Tax=Streptococcus urinalis 2285-97 TaxID=764291 RepID=G5KGF5_9STRE|nr:pneumococcal-type histidine triad protein [Streptococcus urinalis]EHJ56216.1 histidine triad protein [Streptococcus urinalis 2285-97]EKS22322.1 streptococcal histidine triad protein [Streptococcus urinalis FB127-CNA-2]VEF32134.1 histidine triad protein [Streptococcus urinalis]
MKKKYIFISSAVGILLAANIGTYALGKYSGQKEASENQVAYVPNKGKKIKTTHKNQKTPDQISSEEGITAEQIVVKITDQGYVTSHGDHFHFYNGKVPYNALISEELIIKDPNYVFNKSDVINAVKDGYIIKVKGQYYLYLKPGSKRENIRTKAQIAEQAEKGAKEAKANKHGHGGHHLSKSQEKAVQKAKSQGRYTTDDGYIFNPTDVIDDMGDAFLVPHGNHFHYIPKKDLSPRELSEAQAYWNSKKGNKTTVVANSNKGIGRHHNPAQYNEASGNYYGFRPNKGHVITNPFENRKQHHDNNDIRTTFPAPSNAEYKALLNKLYKLPKSKRHVEEDGLVFDPEKVTRANDFGYVMPHGDHYHIIPRNQLSDLEKMLADIHLYGKSNITIKEEKSPKSSTVTHQFMGKTIQAYGKGLDGKPYDTNDGYVFSPESIVEVDQNGVTAKHDTHFHYFGFGELEQDELKAVEKWIASHDISIDKEKLTKQSKTVFDPHKVLSKEMKSGKVGYTMLVDGKSVFYAREQLDLTQIAFAEQELMLKDKTNYKYDIVDNDIKPAALVSVTSLPMHAGNASYDTGSSFVIPHIDHIHVLPYSWLTDKQIATIKYVMQHPEARPDIWSNPGHEQVDVVIMNATPENKRQGLKNWQIIHTADEVKKAMSEGRFTTNDGYIFSAEDLLDPSTIKWKDGSYTIPKFTIEKRLSISMNDLSEAERQEVEKVMTQTPKENSSISDDSKKSESNSNIEENNDKVNDKNNSEESASNKEEKPALIDSIPTYGLDKPTLQAHLNELAKKYNISLEKVIYNDDSLTFYDTEGNMITYDIAKMQELSKTAL